MLVPSKIYKSLLSYLRTFAIPNIIRSAIVVHHI